VTSTGAISVDNDEWYYQVGYVEILYAAMVVGIVIALFLFRRLDRVSALAANLMGESDRLLGLLMLAVILFVINRVLGDLW
jgi:hypothetical protein